METYLLLQHYWWFIVSFLGALLVFLLFVQGGQSFIFTLGSSREEQRMLVNSTGRKWEFTFTTLVTFGGAFFASFPYFYATSFGGAYWVWMLILLAFVIQAISYEYQNKKGNVWGSKTYQVFLLLNGVLGPVLLGTAVATFFTGANFTLSKETFLDLGATSNVMVAWLPYEGVQLHGLEAVLNPWNLVLGLAVFFLARVSGLLYFINNITDTNIRTRARKQLLPNAAIFLVFFLLFLGYLFTASGWAYDPTTFEVSVEKYKFLNNLLAMPFLIGLLLVGVGLVLFGIGKSLLNKEFNKGIWYHGAGVVLTVLTLFLLAGWNNTCYYPSTDLQSSLHIQNSSSSPFTLTVMSWVSLLIPFVFAYIFHAWRQLDLHKINKEQINKGVNY